jgi:glycosyltransferase involved in cell wall biosynthesis
MKPSNIDLIIPTLTRFDLLQRLLDSVKKLKRQPDRIIIIDNSNGQLPDIKETYIVRASNLGVASSWNYGMQLAENDDDIVIFCNDDNILKNEAVAEIERLAIETPSHGFFASQGGGFSFFAVKPLFAIGRVGYFDEGFYPAYYEDNDYHYRMKLENLDFICSDKELYELGVNGQTSQTLNGEQTPQIIKNYIQAGFTSNQYRYVCKWGGLPDKERFTNPFNLNITKLEKL